MSSKGKVVIIKAGNCGHCVRLTPSLPEIEKKLKENGYELIVYEVPIMWGEPKGKYPDVIGVPGWYPFMFFADNDTWGQIKQGKDLRSKINICNGYFDAKNKTYNLSQTAKYRNEPNGIITWLSEIPKESNSNIVHAKFDSKIDLLEDKNNPKIIKIKIIHRKKYGRNRR